MPDSGATEILDALMRNMRDIISTRTVVGDPIQNGGTTILPVMKVALGFGAGAAGGEKAGEPGKSAGGGGGGISITPVGFLVVDEHRALLVTPKSSRFDWVVESLPDLLDKLGNVAQNFRRRRGPNEEGGNASAERPPEK
jgi:uncharacterized spore protein YtfJ